MISNAYHFNQIVQKPASADTDNGPYVVILFLLIFSKRLIAVLVLR